MAVRDKIKVGVYGLNGHQIHAGLAGYPKAAFYAAAAADAGLPAGVKRYGTLVQMLEDPSVDLVSLCSPRRADQADDAVKCLRAGKHVYAEKPCALTERALDTIVETAASTGKLFHEMAGTAFDQPYYAMRGLVASGVIGAVVQVFAQKSYPYHDARPQDEDIDGGLFLQAGVHAARFVEHVAGVRIKTVTALETTKSNPKNGGLRMASCCIAELVNGGLASIIANYLNPKSFGSWGNENLRIFGDKGFVETADGGTRTRLVLNDRDCGPIDISTKPKDFFAMVLDEIDGASPMPMTLEEELHPVRMLIRAKERLTA